jgi:hypothetical protein
VNVCGELWWRLGQDAQDSIPDAYEGVGHRFKQVVDSECGLPRLSRLYVTSPYDNGSLAGASQLANGPSLGNADDDSASTAQPQSYRLIEVVPAEANALLDYDTAQTNDRDLGDARTNVDDASPGRFVNCKTRAQRCCERGRNDCSFAGTGFTGAIEDGSAFDFADHTRNGQDDAWTHEASGTSGAHHVSHEVLGRLEVGDDTPADRPTHLNSRGCAAEHFLCSCTDRFNLAPPGTHSKCDNAWLCCYNPTTARCNSRTRSPEVDGQISVAHA